MQNDEELLAQLRSGNKSAFEQIYDRYAGNLYRYTYNRIRIKEISEEIIQDIFISLWTNREKVNIESLEAYLHGACKYKILGYIRSDGVRKKYATDFMLYLAEHYDNSIEELMDLGDLQHTIEKSIAKLPDKCRTAFRLSRMEHMPIPTIAQHMNISTRTVENYLTQALKHLRTSLGEFLTIVAWFNMMA